MKEIKYKAEHEGKWYEVSTKIPLRKDKKGKHGRQGYIVRLTSNHPFMNKKGYVLEHRLVMEEHLGRFLTKNEVVHHKDGNRSNNDLSNLLLLVDQKVHAGLDMVGKRNANGQLVAQDPIFYEIKFRLFNKNTTITEVFTLSKLIGTTFRRGQFEFRGRFTGLFDKNDKEIYEGDILGAIEYHNEQYEIVFDDGGFKLKSSVGALANATSFVCCIREVIGNVFETQKLIKKEFTSNHPKQNGLQANNNKA